MKFQCLTKMKNGTKVSIGVSYTIKLIVQTGPWLQLLSITIRFLQPRSSLNGSRGTSIWKQTSHDRWCFLLWPKWYFMCSGSPRASLDAPGVNAYTFPRQWILLGKAKEAFDVEGNIINEGTVKFSKLAWIILLNTLEVVNPNWKTKPLELEDLLAIIQFLLLSLRSILMIRIGLKSWQKSQELCLVIPMWKLDHGNPFQPLSKLRCSESYAFELTYADGATTSFT